MVFTTTGRDLVWMGWDDVYIVYQTDSAETHVFNEVTALILRSLDEGSLSTEVLADKIEATLGLGRGELSIDDLAFATMRLEELGLIERLDSDCAVQ